ncbi:MAG: hypothetical protein ACNA7X_03050 [Dehalococcoidia bacterium]
MVEDILRSGERVMGDPWVDGWLTEFVSRLSVALGERLTFVGLHGSWARAEPREGSDIDVAVVIDRVDLQDLATFRTIVAEMPDAGRVASGIFRSVPELKALHGFEPIPFFYGCRVLHGTVEGIIERPEPPDVREHIQVTASASLFHARHYLLYPHDWSKAVHKLYYPFKQCFYALQSWVLLCEGRFVPTKDGIIEQLTDADDREVVRIARDWHELQQDREQQPLYYIELLERWSRNMLLRLQVDPDNSARST